MDTLLTNCPKPSPGPGVSRRRMLAGLGALGGFAVGARALSPTPVAAAGEIHLGGATMGTSYSVKIAGGALSASRTEALHADIQSAFDGVDDGMTLHRATSELRRFNAHPAGGVAVSEQFLTVLREARVTALWSQGAFDPTVAPLVDAWGFGGAPCAGLPSEGAIAQHRESVGFGGLTVAPAQRAVFKLHDALAVDFGGIAKGYAVDMVARTLTAQGFEHFMIKAGGEVRTAGRNAAGHPWAVGIEQPEAWPQHARHVVRLSGRAMATSGDYRNVIDHDGQRYTHEIDPRTGCPIAQGLASVTVVAVDAMQADALATALIVMGPERGFARADRDGIAALFILRDGDGGLTDAPTAAFAALDARRVV